MAKPETKTDAFVRKLLEQAKIQFDEQGSDIKEVNDALKTASKSQKGNAGFPEFVAQVKDFLLVIEDKADLDKHCKYAQKDSDEIVGGGYRTLFRLINQALQPKIMRLMGQFGMPNI